MKENEIPAGANKGKRRLGRGEGNGHGKTCCRGHKGAGARSGYSLRPGFEGGQMPLFRKLPQRGFNRTRFQKPLSVVNLSDLSKLSGQKVNLESLKNAGLIRPNSKAVKILGTGEVDKSYEVEITLVSKSAREKIEAAGGTFASE
jgi:large subunit ribosomal protein L15